MPHRHGGATGRPSPPAWRRVPRRLDGVRRTLRRGHGPRAAWRPAARRWPAPTRPRPGPGTTGATPGTSPALVDRADRGADDALRRRARRRRPRPPATPTPSLARFLRDDYAPQADRSPTRWAPSATGSWSRLFARRRPRPRRDLRLGVGRAAPHRGGHGRRSPSSIAPGDGARPDAVDAPRDRPDRGPSRARTRFRGWLQDLMDRTIAELDGVHFDIPEPVQAGRGDDRPARRRRRHVLHGPVGGLQPARAAPGTRRSARPGSRSGARCRSPTTRACPATTSRSARSATWRDALSRFQRIGRRQRPRRGLGALRRAAHGRARLPRRPRPPPRHAAGPGACGRRGWWSTSACTSGSPSRTTTRFHPGERWTPELGRGLHDRAQPLPGRLHGQRDRSATSGWPGQAISYKVGERVWLAGPGRRRGAATAPTST